MADRILVVGDGRIQDGGTREEMLPRLFPEEGGCACRNEKQEGRMEAVNVKLDAAADKVLKVIDKSVAEQKALTMSATTDSLCVTETVSISRFEEKRTGRELMCTLTRIPGESRCISRWWYLCRV